MATNLQLTQKIYIVTYFENLTIKLYVFYVLNTYIKFYVNWILFIIRFINLFFMHKNLKFKYLINNIIIDLYSFRNFTSVKDTKKNDPITNLLKFISNKNILSEVVFLN